MNNWPSGTIAQVSDSRLFCCGLLLVFSAASFPAQALPDELQVHLDETAKPGQWSADVLTSYALSSPRKPAEAGLRPSLRSLQVSPEFAYGVGRNTEINFQLYASIDAGGQSRVDGARFGAAFVPIRPDDDDDDGVFFGGLVEVGRLPRTLSANRLDAELKLILGYRTRRWLFGVNPEIGVKLSGPGSSAPDVSISAKLAYRLDQAFSLGVEHYGDLGQARHVGALRRQNQQTFGVADFKARGIGFSVGLGRGWNDASPRWTAKTTVSLAVDR